MNDKTQLSPGQLEIVTLARHFNDGQYEIARNLALRMTQSYPKHPFGWKALGAILRSIGNVSESLLPLEKAVKLMPKDAEAHNIVGITFRDLGRLEEAKASYCQAIVLKSDYAEARSNLGNTLRDLGQLENAEASYRQAIILKSDYAETYGNLGNVLRELRRLEGARASYCRAITLNPNYTQAHRSLGVTLRDLGRLDEVEAHYRDALALKSDCAEEYINLGLLLVDMGRLSDARLLLGSGLGKVEKYKWPIASVSLIVCWIMGLYPEANTLYKEYAGATPREESKHFRPLQIFFYYIAELINYYNTYPAAYKTSGAEVPLIAIGDSHSLALNNLSFSWLGGAQVSATSRFVTGLKMFHLAGSTKKYHSIVLSEKLKSLGSNCHLLFAIGEIDCRPDEGIWKMHLRGGSLLYELIENTVDGYIDWVSKELTGRNFSSITVQGIPAPNYFSSDCTSIQMAGFLSMVLAVNKRMEVMALSRGWKFLDIYSATAGEDGLSHGRWHLDKHHVKPSYYQEATKWIKQ